jgi:predicted transcriptional regulator
MTSSRATVGDRELELLRWIEARREASVGEAAEGFGAANGLARSTVLTMFDRLLRKGLLRRRTVDGVYRYRLARSAGKLAREAVAGFVEATLGGSLTPFVAYLAERESIDASEMAELEALIERLRERHGGEES